MKRASKKIVRFNRIEEMASIPSSRRTSSVKDITHQIEEDDVKLNFQEEEMKNIRGKIFLKKVIRKLQGLIAPIKKPPDITQQWQANEENQNIKEDLNHLPLDLQIIRLYPWMRLFNIIHGLSLCIFLWFLSVSIVFQEKIFDQKLFSIAAIQVAYLTIKLWIVNYDQRFESETFKVELNTLKQPFIIFSSCALMILNNQIDIKAINVVINILMFIVCILLGRKIPKYFKVIKTYAEEHKLIKQLRIIELFCVLLVVTHIFGLIMYSAIYLCPSGEMTWLDSPGNHLMDKSFRSRYIYSVYFAITTIVTVGYGDLTPQNQAQVIIIMILEICGTSFFGYMINVIGITVDNINKKNEEYDNYQQTISKLKDNYQLSEELCFQMKRDIENKYNRQDRTVSLNKNEQMEFLQYVDSTVKKNFILQTNIKIIKKSIFFLTYFTVNFQNYVALKLIRVIYKKDENIQTYDPITKQKNIIIINHGKVNMFIQKRQNNIIKNKLVRTIEPIEGKPTLNVIGYSSLILNMDISLFSKASEMTSGYVLRMSDVLESIDKSMIDYESFHEMRQKMLLFPIKQSIEAPSMIDSNYHFSPNIFIISCRYNRRARNPRQKIDRKKKRGFLVIDKVSTNLQKGIYNVNYQEESLYEDSEVDGEKQSKNKKIEDFGSLLSVDGQEILDNLDMHHGPQHTIKPEDKLLRVDQVKIFEYFMKNHNVNIVASQYQDACQTRSYKIRGQTQRINSKKFQTRRQIRDSLLKDMKKNATQKRILLPVRL